MDWQRHDGGPNPAVGQGVDLRWGIGIIENRPSSQVNWSFRWTWRPSRSSALPAHNTDASGPSEGGER